MCSQPGDGSSNRVRRWIVSLAIATASVVPMMQAPALAATPAPPGSFACDSDMWQALRMDQNHDNLFARFDRQTATPGEAVTFSLVWEWRDWRPGAELVFRHCLDVDATPDGVATAPFDGLGGNPADVTVVHPTQEPTATAMKDTEVRPAVVMPFTITVPAAAPVGSEVCERSALLPNENHMHSPPGYDISETVCITVVPAQNVPPAPAPAPPPETSSNNMSTTPAPPPAPQPAPPAVAPQPPPESEVLGLKVLPRTGLPFWVLLSLGALFLLGGAAVVRRLPRPFLVMEDLRQGRRRG